MKIKFIYYTVVSLVAIQFFSGCAGSQNVNFDSGRVIHVADSLASDLAMDYYLTGSIHEEAGELYQAAIKYQFAHLYDPNSAAIIMALSNVYNLIGEQNAAVTVLEQGWFLNPQDDELSQAIIRTYLRHRKFDEVLTVYNSISQNRNLTKDELYIKAALLTKMNKLDAALKVYDELLSNFEPTPLVYDKIARIHLLTEDVESAEVILIKLLELDQGNHKVRFVLGGFAVARQNWEKAEEFFWSAIALDSLQVPYWRNVLLAIGQQQDLDGQLSASERAVDIFPEVPQFYDILAGTLQDLEQFDEAVIAANKSIQLDSARMSPRLTKAYIYHQLERWDLSSKSYKAALNINSESPLVLNNYAYMFALQNANLDEALEMSNKAIELEPKNSSFLDTKAWLLFRQEKYSEALKHITIALDYGEENAEIMNHLASIHEALGNKELAIKARGRAVELEKIENK